MFNAIAGRAGSFRKEGVSLVRLRVIFLFAMLLAVSACSVALEGRDEPADAGSESADDVDAMSDTEAATAQDDAPPSEPPTEPEPEPAAEPDTDVAVEAPPTTVRIAFGGDVHGEAQVGRLLGDGGNPLAALEPILAGADFTVVNLETAVGSSGSPTGKTYVFQASPALTDTLAAAGVDAVTVANNHALDFGTDALAETIALAEQSGLVVVGGGANAAEAYAPRYVDIGGIRVALVGLTRVIPVPDWAATDTRPGLASAYEPGLPQALAAIEEADAVADVVVVAVHWGLEGTACPAQQQTSLARAFVDAGADVVAGHHPHVLQGVQETGGALVAYSLGNFVWYASSEASRTTGVLMVEVGRDGVASWDFIPARIDDTGSPQPLAGEDGATITDLVAARSPDGPICASTDWP